MQAKRENQEICPLCRLPLQLMKVSRAAEVADISEKTVYRYIEEGSIYAIKVAGKTYRVCKHCLLRPCVGE
ncbi:MAG: helix-turn-helix domain-containing protein [Blastocatellia bacterium]